MTRGEKPGQAQHPEPDVLPGASGRGLAVRLSAFNDWYLHRIPGGMGRTFPRVPINLHKALVGPLVLALMLVRGDFSLAALLYLALHGCYGVLWIVKDVAFPDQGWRRPCSVGSAVAVFVYPLGLYLLAPLIMLTPLGEWVPGGWGTTASLPVPVAFAAVVLFVAGAFLHFVADAQKHFVLECQRPRRLITSGLFAATRNPNYLGEIMIYSAFCLLAQHWLPWAACALVWATVFLPNMLAKDRSMSRYPEFAAWKAHSGLVLPRPMTLLRALPAVLRTGRQGTVTPAV
jgi:protein-S-isoprenylcysteine O-methyltransferase Ste14